jgi:hypothetical protein
LNAVYSSLVGSELVFDKGLTGWSETYWSSSQKEIRWWVQAFNDGE